VLVITLGTGLGSGLIVGGELVHGASGHAGELGHVCVEPGGRSCNCGLKGCLETWVSAGGLLHTARELGLDLSPWCDTGEAPSPRALHRAAEAGEPRAAQVFEHTGLMLARGLACAVHVLSPGRIVVCGGITRAGEWLLEPVRRHLPPLLMEPFRDTYRLEFGQLDPDCAGVLGAAAWARRGLAGFRAHA
jgi:glucokinase